MHTPIRGILANLANPQTKNIILSHYSDAFDFSLAETGHNFYYLNGNKKIDKYNILHITDDFIKRSRLDIDINMAIFPYNDLDKDLYKMVYSWHIPVLVVQHAVQAPPTSVDNLSSVFLSDTIKDSWKGNGDIIHPGVEIRNNVKFDKKYHILLIDYENNYNLNYIIDNIPQEFTIRVVKQSLLEKKDFDECKIYINTHSKLTIQYPILEALESKCMLITNRHLALFNHLKHNENCKIADDKDELIEAIYNYDDKIVDAGNSLVRNKFDKTTFLNTWNRKINEQCLKYLFI